MTDTTFVRRVGIGSVEALESPFPPDVYIIRVNLWRDRSVCLAFMVKAVGFIYKKCFDFLK